MQSPPQGTAKISFYTWQMSQLQIMNFGQKVKGYFRAIVLRRIPNTRRPDSGGISGGVNGGINEGINGGIMEGIERVADYIRNTPGRNVTEITTALDIPQRTVERWIKKLREQGRIVFVGPRKTGGYQAR